MLSVIVLFKLRSCSYDARLEIYLNSTMNDIGLEIVMALIKQVV
jgi:hypothetical protein